MNLWISIYSSAGELYPGLEEVSKKLYVGARGISVFELRMLISDFLVNKRTRNFFIGTVVKKSRR